MRVGELARAAGVSARAIRYYDAHGLLTSHRRPNGYRDFAATALTEVTWIRRLAAAGITIDDICSIWPCLTPNGAVSPCAEARAVVTQHAERLSGQIERDQTTLRALHLVLASS